MNEMEIQTETQRASKNGLQEFFLEEGIDPAIRDRLEQVTTGIRDRGPSSSQHLLEYLKKQRIEIAPLDLMDSLRILEELGLVNFSTKAFYYLTSKGVSFY